MTSRTLATSILLIFFIHLTSVAIVHAQTGAVRSDVRGKTLSEALKIISEETAVIIAFDEALVEDHIVQEDIRGLNLDKALERLLEPAYIQYRRSPRGQVVLLPKSRSRNIVSNPITPKRPQSRQLKGQILDAQSGEALAYASIRINQSKAGTVSDEDGYFVLRKFPLQTESLQVHYYGFESQKILIEPDHHFVEIQMVPTSDLLDEIVITEGSDQVLTISDAAALMTINPRKVESLSGLGEPDIIRALQFLPGINSADESASALNIRGGKAEENLILFDGITIYQPGHLFGSFSAFNNEAVRTVDVQRSSFDAYYGGRASGVIDIVGQPDQLTHPELGFGLNLLNCRAHLKVPFAKKKGAVLIAARRSFSDIYNNPFYAALSDRVLDSLLFADRSSNGIGNLDALPDFQFYDFNAKITYQAGEKDFFFLSAYGGQDNLFYSWLDKGLNDSSHYLLQEQNLLQNLGLSANWTHQWNPKFYSRINAALSGFQNEFFLEIGNPLFPDNTSQLKQFDRIWDLTIRMDHNWKPHDRLAMDIGVHATQFRLDSLITVSGVPEPAPFTQKDWLISPYAQYAFQPLEKLHINMGIRINYYNPMFRWYAEPRASITYDLSPKIRLKAAWGIIHQFLNRTQQNADGALIPDAWVMAEEGRIPVLRAEHLTLGAAYENNGFLIDVEWYQKKLNGLIMYRQHQRYPLVRDLGLLTGGTGEIWGVDFMIQKKIGQYTGWVSYAYNQVLHQFNDLNSNQPFSASHEQRHQISLVNIWTLGKWDASLNWIFASGKPYTEAKEVLSQRRPFSEEYDHYIGFGPIHSSRLPAYHRMDLSLSRKITWGDSRHQGKIGLSVYNVYNRNNIQGFTYRVLVPDSKAEDAEIVRFDKSLLGFTPNAFLNLTF